MFDLISLSLKHEIHFGFTVKYIKKVKFLSCLLDFLCGINGPIDNYGITGLSNTASLTPWKYDTKCLIATYLCLSVKREHLIIRIGHCGVL